MKLGDRVHINLPGDSLLTGLQGKILDEYWGPEYQWVVGVPEFGPLAFKEQELKLDLSEEDNT